MGRRRPESLSELRKVQVKGSVNAFEKAAVTNWAKELSEAASGVDAGVLLCGPITGGVSDMLKTGVHGVRIECVSHDLQSLAAVCENRLHHALHQASRYGVGPDDLTAAIPRLAGVLFAEAVRARRWSREELWQEVLRAVEPAVEPLPPLSWCQNRIVQVQATGDCVEIFIVSFYNPTAEEIPVPGVITRLTDSRNSVRFVFDGMPELEGEAGPLGGVYNVWTPPRETCPPHGWRHLVARPENPPPPSGILR